MSARINLVFDLKQRRPACVLLQAAFGCGENNGFMQSLFPSQTWLVNPTDDMRVIAGTREEWEKAAKMSEQAIKKS